MKIEITDEGFDEIQTALEENEKIAQLALRRTINKVATQTSNYLIRETAGKLALNRNQIREPFSIRKATGSNLAAEIKVRRIAVPLIDYKPRQLKRGHSIRVNKDKGRQRLERTFEATIKGKNQLFQREELKRGYPIRQMFGPAVIEVTQDYMGESAAKAQKKMLTIFQHEFEFALS
jgi:hypothetical protein